MTLPAGRELDALVAEKVMKLLVIYADGETDCVPVIQESIDTGRSLIRADLLPHYSADIAAAWEVFERFTGDGRHPLVRYDGLRPEGYPYWTVAISGHRGDADTAPLAICLAALAAVGIE